MKRYYLYVALAAATSLSLASCSDDSGDEPQIVVPDSDDNNTSDDDDDEIDPANFTIPTYADDYSSISGWADRAKWNLANVHDPSVVYWTDGYYYMWGTDASYGNAHEGHGHFQGKRSKDLVNWEWVPGIFYDQARPSWILEKVNEYLTLAGKETVTDSDLSLGCWAPCARKVTVNGLAKIRMYFSIVFDGTANPKTMIGGNQGTPALIGVCETTDPNGGTWEHLGFVTCSSADHEFTTSNLNATQWGGFYYYNAIDPTYIITPDDEHWLIHGSWHSGFAALQINPLTGKPLYPIEGSPWLASADAVHQTYGVNVSSRSASSRWQASEGPEVIYHDGYYYLFMAYDGLDVPYNTRVVRAEKITGPYYDITGRNNTNGRGDCYPVVTHPYKFQKGWGWVGISHCCIFPKKGKQDATDWFYMSQGRLPAGANGNAYANAIMMGHVRKLVWAPASASDLTNRWPIALPERYAAVPNYGELTADSIVGKWEHIDLSYNYGVQDESSYVNFNENGTITDNDGNKVLGGEWKYDATNKLLIIGSAAICVEREVDWEATPRCVTLVYAGIGQDGKTTWWGKKVE